MKNRFGLSESIINQIKETLLKYKNIESAYIFGSRAKNKFRNNSDIDILVEGKDFSTSELIDLKYDISNLPIIYNIDVVDFNNIKNSSFKKSLKNSRVKIF